MNWFRVLAIVLALILSLLRIDVCNASKAEVSETGSSLISLRAGQHPRFYRIVLEGAEEIVSKGHVNQKEKDIKISFDDASIDVEKTNTPFAYKADSESVIISLPKKGEMKVFSLKKPSRLVVDVYPQRNEKKTKLLKRKYASLIAVPTNNEATVSADTIKKISEGERKPAKQRTPEDDRSIILAGAGSERDMGKSALAEQRRPEDDRSVVLTGKDDIRSDSKSGKTKQRTPEDDRSVTIVEEKTSKKVVKSNKKKKSKRKRSKNAKSVNEHPGLDDIIVPEKFEELWGLLQSGNAIGNLKKLGGLEPEGTEELAFYYYLYGEGYIAGGQYIKAIDNLRLAYIYSDSSLKEHALFRRAKVYDMMGLHHEARSNFLVFINEFPASKKIEKAYFGLANCSQKKGLLNEAVMYYAKAGNDAVTLFHKANALQKLERVEEAKKIYEAANKVDSSYPKRSFETYYLIGENMRLSGELKKAKEHFNSIQYGPFLDSAKISLGLIAMDEANIKEAGRNFLHASQSKNRNVRVRALFSLAFALLSIGQTQEAIEALEEIRFKHLDSDLYKDALLALARLYHKEGKIREAVSVVKELAYGKKPPLEVFSELESIVLDLSKKEESADSDELTFLELWKEVDRWLMDESREEFLLRIAERLRYEGKPFIRLSIWLVENGSSKARVKASVALADYYIGIGRIALAEAYMTRSIDIGKPDDDALRVKAKILRVKGEYMSAVQTIALIKKFEKEDLTFVGNILLDMDKAKSAQRTEAISFYENKLNESEWDTDHYVRLADILYKNNSQSKALKYYRIAYKKNPDDEWILYRIGRDENGQQSKKLFAQLDKGGTMLGRIAKSKLLEINLLNKIREVY
jgi:tetratricopeptide (TPR) repeat protein